MLWKKSPISAPLAHKQHVILSVHEQTLSYQSLKNANVGAVILGAGFGRRFGSDKRLAALGDTTVAAQTVTHFSQVFAHLKVVLKTQDTALGELLGQQAEILYTDQSHLGMGHSLAAGFTDLNWQWAFVGLLDMPFLKPATLEQIALRATTTTQRIIRPVFAEDAAKIYDNASDSPSSNERPKNPQGHPIGIHSSLFAQVRKSSGDQGAKWLLKEYANSIDDIAVSDAGIFMDIDQPKDLLAQP